jgi:hypothetical protein
MGRQPQADPGLIGCQPEDCQFESDPGSCEIQPRRNDEGARGAPSFVVDS